MALSLEKPTPKLIIDLDNIRCVRCNRPLKTAESIARGMGKTCFEKSQVSAKPKSNNLYLTPKAETNLNNFVKNYFSTPKTSLFETTREKYNYIWAVPKSDKSYYKKWEIRKLENLISAI